MMNSLKEIYSKTISTTVFKNMMSLGFIQVANYIIPILIIPFVVRALGVDFFGKATYAQNIITYLTILVNYGFEYSATQDIAINKNNPSKLKSIFWTVVRFKGILLIVSFIVLFLLSIFFTKVKEDRLLYFYAALINVGFVLFPTWFFQGIEKMTRMSFFNFLIKLLGAVFILLLIHTPSDYRIYLLLLSLSYVLVGLIAFLYVVKKYNLYFSIEDKKYDSEVIKKGFPIFLNVFFATLYSIAGLTILGFYLNDYDLGIYSGAYKIVMAVVMLTSMPISIALFPLMSRKFNESVSLGFKFFKKCLLIVGVFATLASILIFVLSPMVVNILLGENFKESIPLLRVFSILPFLVVMASMLTVQGMYGLQLQRYAPYVGGTIGLFCVGISLLLIPKYGIYGAAYGYIFSEVLEIILVFIVLSLFKNKVRA